jgi:hypothetical protein
MSHKESGKGSAKAKEPVTEEARTEGAGERGRLAGPRPPDRSQEHDTPVMGIVPPDPNMADEVGDMDLTRGDPNRVRESPRGSGESDAERAADERRRRQLYEEGASEVSED